MTILMDLKNLSSVVEDKALYCSPVNGGPRVDGYVIDNAKSSR